MIVQKRLWLAWPPALLRTVVRIPSGTRLRFRISSSTDSDWRSGWSFRALLALVMYA